MGQMLLLKVRQGETLSLSVEEDDTSAETVTIIVKESVDDVSPLIYHTANFVNGSTVGLPLVARVADLTLDDGETGIPTGEYIYQLTVTYTDGLILKYPDASTCEDECDFPPFVVCDALDPGVS